MRIVAALAFLGCGYAVLMVFQTGSLYTVYCDHFSLTADKAVCRGPVIWEIVAAVALLVAVVALVIALLRRRRSNSGSPP